MGLLRHDPSVRVKSVLFATTLLLAPALAHAQQTPPQTPPAAAPVVAAPAAKPAQGIDALSIAIGTGAIAGVVGFNLAVLGWGALPGGMAYGAAAVVPAEMAVAINRVYAVTTAVGGGWLGEYIYNANAGASGNQPDRLLSVGIGAMLGVAAFTAATYALGSVPFTGAAAIEAVPVSVMLGSRLIAAASAGLGALAGAWAYDTATGQQTDTRYALTLFSGAAAGVAVANVLTNGAIGSVRGALGAGAMEAGAVIASTAAATTSRVIAVTAAVGGALAADRWFYGAATTK